MKIVNNNTSSMKRSLYKYVWRSFFMGEIAEIKHKFYLSHLKGKKDYIEPYNTSVSSYLPYIDTLLRHSKVIIILRKRLYNIVTVLIQKISETFSGTGVICLFVCSVIR